MSQGTKRIFVQIPAYRDTQLVPTIESLLAAARNPERLSIWVCWQRGPKDRFPKRLRSRGNVNLIDVDYRKSEGAGWARATLQQKWNNEPYSLLVDSHTRFAEGWDDDLVEMMRLVKSNGIKKPIISTLPPSFYDPQLYPSDRVEFPTKIYPSNYERGMLIRFYGGLLPLSEWLSAPIPAQFLAMGFLFTEGTFNAEIRADPEIYFFGDDITTALRAYCHGYDLFHPHRVVAWHLYDRTGRVPHWEDHADWAILNESWTVLKTSRSLGASDSLRSNDSGMDRCRACQVFSMSTTA